MLVTGSRTIACVKTCAIIRKTNKLDSITTHSFQLSLSVSMINSQLGQPPPKLVVYKCGAVALAFTSYLCHFLCSE